MKLDRRTLLLSLPVVAALPRSIYAFAASKRTQLLIGTGTDGKSTSKGIYVADWNLQTGELGAISLLTTIDDPTFMALDKKHERLFAITEGKGKITAFKIQHAANQDLSLVKVNAQDTKQGSPAHVSINPDGGSIYVSNYGGGSLVSYKVQADGSLSDPVSYFLTKPVDSLSEHRQPHIHEATPTPDGKWLLVNDLGSDRIWIYSIDRATGTLTPAKQAFWQGRDKSGPRHLNIHPNHRWVYSANELDSTVDHLAWDGNLGTLTTLGNYVPTLPPENKSKSYPSEITISHDGRFAYVGNRTRGDEGVTVFAIDQQTGALNFVQLAIHGGAWTRDLTIDPTGKFLLTACQNSGTIIVMGRDAKTGKLSAPLHTYKLDSPECLIFTT